MEAVTYHVPPEEDGTTVRHILRARLRFSARAVSRLKGRETGIQVNGERAFTNRVLHAGDVLRAETGDCPPAVRPAERRTEQNAERNSAPDSAAADRCPAARGGIVPGNWPLPVVWEDGHLLVVDKPAGMTAHASNFSPDDPTVAGALAWRRIADCGRGTDCGRSTDGGQGADFVFHPVNRLDRGTTGLMVVAQSGYIHDRLRRTLHTDEFKREYLAVTVGVPVPAAGTIAAPIGRDEGSLVARRVRPDGKPAVTHYKVLSAGNGLCLVEVRPETGRTHQIRVHMAHLGCPLAGDWLYGREDPALIDRPALHSHRLELVHPVTGEVLRLTAPLPPDMARLVRGMEVFKEASDMTGRQVRAMLIDELEDWEELLALLKASKTEEAVQRTEQKISKINEKMKN